MIDVHINTRKSDNKEYLQQCLESLNHDRVNVIMHPFDDRGVGYARLSALDKGNSDLFAFVDPDDYIEPGTFDRGLKILKNSNYSAYFTNHWVVKDNKLQRKWFHKLRVGGFTQETLMHHVVIFRKHVVEPVLPLLAGVKTSDIKLLNLQSILHGEVYGEEYCGYYWRCDGGMNHTKYKPYVDNPVEWGNKVKQLRNEILENRNP